ncbi:hypothetical protein [Priestia koreensis]|uniref:Hydrolase n=1 Tax=Priestia koreensis TaxID=284581 RepID=A0A0M0L6V0_9BACI|nr:hypothetical protein [Priestia koreensis]KOO46759.1 hydrolase [Priestia koreensis]
MNESTHKKTYYINVGYGEISLSKSAFDWNYVIQATDDEITHLRDLFNGNDNEDWQGFFRAHVPYIQYHFDRQNDAYDQGMSLIYEQLYKLGDDATKQHIKEMNILPHIDE